MTLGEEFKQGPNGNFLAEYDGFAVSYRGQKHPTGISMFDADSPDGETALMVGSSYFILNGDWRLSYSELAPKGVEACMAFFMSKAGVLKSSFSD